MECDWCDGEKPKRRFYYSKIYKTWIVVNVCDKCVEKEKDNFEHGKPSKNS